MAIKFLLILIGLAILALHVNDVHSYTCVQKNIATGRVRNIVDSRPTAWPWIAAIFNSTTKEYLFSGGLISREHVIIGN